VSAVLWQGALILYVRFQMGVSGYSALYSALGAVPIFLVWTYVSWVIVLVGAQVAASHQGHQVVRQRLDAQRTDQVLRERVGVIVAARVARDFISDARPPGEAALAEELDVPEPVIHEVVDALVRARVLSRTLNAQEAGLVPARDPDHIHLRDVQDALRQDERAGTIRAHVERGTPSELGRLLHEADAETRRSEHNVSLRRLAGMVAPGDEAGVQRSPPGG